MDVHYRDPQELRGVDGLVVVQTEHGAIYLLHPRPHEGLGDVDRDALVVEQVGLERHDLAEAGARGAERMVPDERGYRLSLLPEAVGQEHLGRTDVDAPHHADGVDVLVGEVGQPGVRVGVPQALRVVEVLAVRGQGVVGPGGVRQDPVDDVLGADVLPHAGLDGQPVGFLNLHAKRMPIARFIFAPARSLEERDDGVDVVVPVPVVRAPVPSLPLLGDALLREGDQDSLSGCHFFVSCAGLAGYSTNIADGV